MRLLLLAPLLLAGCAAGEQQRPPASVEGVSRAASGVACVAPSPLAAPPDPPPPVVLPAGSVLTDVTEQAGQRLVTGQVASGVDQVLAHFRADPGYVVTKDEDEGRSGRLSLFGSRGEVAVTVSLLTCPRGLTGFTISAPAPQPSAAG